MSKIGFAAGALGAVTMSVIMALARAFGVPINLEMLVGSAVTRTLGPVPWFLGFLLHVGIGAAFGMVYAWILSWLRLRPGATTGAWIGLVHAVIVGAGFVMLPALHPLVPELYAAPGPFFIHYGIAAAITFVSVHLIYGAIVGAIVARKRR